MTNRSCPVTRWYDRRGGRLLLSAAVFTLLTGLSLLLLNVAFLTNDDTAILYALAGYRSGTPFITHSFINWLLGAFVSTLYRLLPAVPWWSVLQLCMLDLSFTLIGACLLKSCRRAGLPLAVPLAGMLLLYGTMFVYTVLWIAFTLTAAMLGAAAVALIVALDPANDTRAERRCALLSSAALMLLCFLFRNSSGLSLVCFWAAAVFYRVLPKARGEAWHLRPMLVYAGVCAALFAALVWSNNWGIEHLNAPGFSAFESARSCFSDYAHAGFSEDPALYARYGWDETIAGLAEKMGFLDEHVTAESMMGIYNAYSFGGRSLVGRVFDGMMFGMRFFRTNGAAEYMLVVPALLLLWCVALFLRKKRGGAELLTACAVSLGAFVLCLYLCFKGRFPLRSFQVIATPTAVMGALFAAILYGKNRDDPPAEGARSRSRRAPFVLLCCLSALLLGWSLCKTLGVVVRYDERDRIAETAAAEAYVMERPENIYISDLTFVRYIGAFTVYPDRKPTNLIDWGGTGMYSGWKQAQLALNGISVLNGDVFRRENAYFICRSDDESLPLLAAYLEKHAGAVGYERVDRVTDRIEIYRFRFEEVTP